MPSCSAAKTTVIPCALPSRRGTRIRRPPVALQSASVRTAETAPLNVSQHESTLTTAHEQIEKTVCASGRYSDASLKSTTESSGSMAGMRRAIRRGTTPRIKLLGLPH